MVQFVPSGDVWIWNAVAYAVSHCSTTWLRVAVLPRSTSSHWGSEKALDHLVPVLPSTAAEAGKVAFSVEDAVAGCPWESRVAACALPAAPAVNIAARASTASSTPMMCLR